jgi:putative oxidoreductase
MTKFDFALFLLRVFFGISMAYHGINKIRGNGLDGTSAWFNSLGMRWPRAQAVTASTSEIIGGVLLAIGLVTPLASTIFIALMIVAIRTVHWKVGFFIFLPNGGWEYCASIAVVATSISLLGPGKISIDESVGLSQTFGVMAFPIAVVVSVCHLALSYRPKKTTSSS